MAFHQMERARGSLSWKLEFLKKRVSSLRDLSSRPLHELSPLQERLNWMEQVLNQENGIPNSMVSEIVQRMEDFLDEVEYQVLNYKCEVLCYENSIPKSLKCDPEYEVGDDPTYNTSHKKICRAADNSFSGTFTSCYHEGSGQNEKPECSNNRIKHTTYACEKEVFELVSRMDEVVAREKILDDPNGSSQREREKIFNEEELLESHAEEDNIKSSYLRKRKKTCEEHIVDIFSFSDHTKLEAYEVAHMINKLVHYAKLHDGNRRKRDSYASRSIPTSSFTDAKIFGREKDENKILKMLFLEIGSGDAISVLPITGMGGLGKTTLAKLVYNNKRVRRHFDMRGWVFVSLKTNIVTLMRELIESFTEGPCDVLDLDHLSSKLQRIIQGLRIFIVLDDVWEMSDADWEFIMSSLQSARSVRILLTTRSNEIAIAVQTIPAYCLGYLSEEDSWSLFKQNAFGYRDASVDRIEIAKKIVNKCGGLPLALKMMRSVLKYEEDIELWREISNSELWEVEADGDYMPALYLSYKYLPPCLKVCFVIFSLFPKGFVFSKDDVIPIWISLNFLEHENSTLPKYIGSVYFDKLLQRSLIQRNQRDKTVGGYVMHDLVHDLAQFMAGQDFSRIEDNSQSIVLDKRAIKREIGKTRYLSVIVSSLPNTINFRQLQDYKKLKILKIINSANKWNNNIRIDISNEQFQFLKFLRVLDFSYTGIDVLPHLIGNLRQLCYLNLTKTNVKALPESICNLCNLQILELRDCSIQELPRGIINLVNLRHLNFFDKNTCMPCGIGALTNLQILPIFNIKKGIWHCHISELKGLVNLCGELTITGLRNVTSVACVKEANLREKKHLHNLTLDWTTGDNVNCDHSNFEATTSSHEQCSEEEVLDWLQPNFSLEELHIHDYSGSKFPDWLGHPSFSVLSKISISNCGQNCEFLPTLGLLPSLKSLSIQWMYSTQRIGCEFCSGNVVIKGFQALKTLEFKYLPNWVEWCGVEDGEFVKLNMLRIVCCHELQSLPQRLSSSLTKLVIGNCKELRSLPFLPSLTQLALSGELSESLFHNLHLKSLRFLKITSSESITCILLNGENFPSLEVLVIKGCINLEYFMGVSSMTSLKRLEIVRCPWLRISSNEEIPSMLQHMTIHKCPLLQEWHQVMIVKYKNQLRKHGGSMHRDNFDVEMMDVNVSEGHDLEVGEECIEAEKRREGKTILVGECSHATREVIHEEDGGEKMADGGVWDHESNMKKGQLDMEAEKIMEKETNLRMGEGSYSLKEFYERDILPMKERLTMEETGNDREMNSFEFDEFWESLLLMNNEMCDESGHDEMIDEVHEDAKQRNNMVGENEWMETKKGKNLQLEDDKACVIDTLWEGEMLLMSDDVKTILESSRNDNC